MRLPEKAREDNFVREIASYGCLTRMHVVRLLAPQIHGEDHARDIDFSANGIRTRWSAGYSDTRRVLQAEPWKAPVDPIEGFVLHEANAGEMQVQS
jgi:NTE family protein